ncbi:orotidine-5'-phosphate decarboxylase [candidate division KSB1 bacterium]|nr:orotidine-5'-phosphate decarboxylase [candidate division KSB1 bacterium]
MSFNSRLAQICQTKKSYVCVGLDVDIEKMPAFLRSEADPLYVFSKAIIEATADYVAAFKINIAFFEAYGKAGWDALERIVASLPENVIRIADAKRADIGNSSQRYAHAFLHAMPFDAITVNPYLGYDSVKPFIENTDKGAFILCITSNPGSNDFQHFNNGDEQLFEKVARTVSHWNTLENCGLVTGATHPEELARVRQLAPNLPLLIPGIGAQGGDLELSVKNALTSANDKALFNSSRGIIYSASDHSFAEKAGKSAGELQRAINNALIF